MQHKANDIDQDGIRPQGIYINLESTNLSVHVILHHDLDLISIGAKCKSILKARDMINVSPF